MLPRRRRIVRRILRVFGGFLALLVVLNVVLVIVLHTAWGRGLVRDRVVATLNEQFPGGASIGEITGSVFGELVLHDVRLAQLDGTPFAEVRTLRVDLALLPLVRRIVRVDALTVEHVHVTVPRESPLRPAPDEDAPSQWTVDLRTITVRDARVTYDGGTPETQVELESAALGAEVHVARSGAMEAHVLFSGRARGQTVSGAATVHTGEEVVIPSALLSIGAGMVTATDVRVGAPSGGITLAVPRALLGALVPDLAAALAAAPAGDLLATATLGPAPAVPGEPGGSASTIGVAGALGHTVIDARLRVDIAARTAAGLLSVGPVPLDELTGGAVRGPAHAVIIVAADPDRVRATVLGGARPVGGPAVHAVAAFDGPLAALRTGASVRGPVLVLAHAEGGADLGLVGAVRMAGADLVLDDVHARVRADDLAALSGGRVPVTGRVSTDLVVTGPIAPTLALAVSGRLAGDRLASGDVRVGGVRGRYDLRLGPAAAARGPGGGGAPPVEAIARSLGGAAVLTGLASLDVRGVTRAGAPLGEGTATVRVRADRTLAVTTRLSATTAAAPVVAELDAIVDPRDLDSIRVRLGAHRIAMRGATWQGTGGDVRITPAQIRVRGVRSRAGEARIAADATVSRLGGGLALALVGDQISLALVDPALGGTASGTVSLTHRGRAWTGQGTVAARGLVLGPDLPPIDGDLELGVVGRQVRLAGTARNATLGAARVDLEVTGPADLLDIAAWQRVPRTDLAEIALGLEGLQLDVATGGVSAGTVDGTLRIRAGAPEGTIALRGVSTPVGLADADLRIARADAGRVDLAASLTAGGLGGDVTVRLRTPDRPFDVRAWRALGPRVLDGASVRTPAIEVGPALWALLGLDLPFYGKVAITADVQAGAVGASLDVIATDVLGGPLVRPLGAHVTASVDATGTRASAEITGPGGVTISLPDARSSASLDAWLRARRLALAAPITGVLRVPRTSVRAVLALLGRGDVERGCIEGELTLGDTLAAPRLAARVDLRDVAVRSRLIGRPPPVLTSLHLEGRWDGTTAHLAVSAAESHGGTLSLEGSGRPGIATSVQGRLAIAGFDLAPLAAFLPGPLVGASGKLDAALAVRGLSLAPGAVRGRVALVDGRVPLLPQLGTLRRAAVSLDVDERGLRAKLVGRIGGGSIDLAIAANAGASTATVTGSIAKLGLITELRPVLDAKLRGTLRRDGLGLRGAIEVVGASVVVPPEAGTELLDTVLPEDVIFVDRPLPVPKVIGGGRAPEHPWLVLDVALRSTKIDAPEFAIVESVRGEVAGALTVSVGTTVGVEGIVRVERANAEVFGHRYAVDLGEVQFDGDPLNPEFDLRLTHAFRDVTTFVRLSGRLARLDRIQRELTSDPSTYSENQLLGFLLGGSPGGDPTQQTADTGTALLGSVVSTSIARRLKKLLPVTLHVAGCTPGAGGEGSSCTFGRWLDEKTFIAYRRRLDARPDESTSEGRLEYYILPSLSLEVGAEANRAGADILWRKRL